MASGFLTVPAGAWPDRGSGYKKQDFGRIKITFLIVNIGFHKLFIEIYTGNSSKLEDNTCTVRIYFLYLSVILIREV